MCVCVWRKFVPHVRVNVFMGGHFLLYTCEWVLVLANPCADACACACARACCCRIGVWFIQLVAAIFVAGVFMLLGQAIGSRTVAQRLLALRARVRCSL